MSRILLIEDDPLCATAVAGTLSRMGHAVVTHYNALAALRALRGDLFDLVISDVMMPGKISGFDLARWIRKNARICDTPIAFLTGLGDTKDVKRALACGVDDYMVKPADPEILASKVKSLLDRNHTTGSDFAQRAIHEFAGIEVEVLVTSISEAGLTLSLPFPMRPTEKFRMAGKLLETIGIGVTHFRVLSCQCHGDHKYSVDALFVGLSESKLQLIRRWIVCNPIQSRNK